MNDEIQANYQFDGGRRWKRLQSSSTTLNIYIVYIQMFTNYAFTLRKTNIRRRPTEKDYTDHMYKIFDKNGLNVFDYQFESENGLHVHGCVSVPFLFEDQMYKLRTRGWRCHMVSIYDLSGWISYYNKHIRNPLSSVVNPLANIISNIDIDAKEENAKEGTSKTSQEALQCSICQDSKHEEDVPL